jgi:hypothetical protein
MRGPGEKLTRKQQVAIAALLTVPTIADAAHAANISQPTLQTAYRQARQEVVSQAVVYLPESAVT